MRAASPAGVVPVPISMNDRDFLLASQTVLDARGAPRYRGEVEPLDPIAGHIPGAVFLHCDRDLSGVMTGCNGRHPLPDPEQLAQRLGDIGIGAVTQVVVYDDAQGMIAGRLWWLLRWLGHDAVALLDGGLPAWQAAGLPLDCAVPVRHSGGGFLLRPALEFTLDADALQARLADPQLRLIDARAANRFAGQDETLDPVGGHIPGALNRFFQLNLTENGLFKPADGLAEEWSALLAGQPAASAIHQCGSGVTACHNLLALAHAGLGGGWLYPGSWSEWCADPSRPVATGPAH